MVSVIVPLYNEEKYIEKFLMSLVEQTYPLSDMEWILIDGNSEDKTVEIISRFVDNYPIILLVNEKRKTPYALNMAIRLAKGKYIIRLDAHAYFPPDYIEKCVYYLDTTDADNVGGVAETDAFGFCGKAIAQMLSTKFGVGSSDFRVSEGDKYVDTVPFGAFRRSVFEKVGLFNTKLLRSEDNDMNARIRNSGGKIWLSNDIKFKYYCRDSISGILKMGIQNGNALFWTLKENPKAMSIRHFIPFLFFVSVIVFPLLAIIVPEILYLFVVEIVCYGVLDVIFSFLTRKWKYGVITVWLYPAFHFVYGLGSFVGLIGVKLY